MFNKENNSYIAIPFVAGLLPILVLIAYMSFRVGTNGIYPSDDGEAVYLEGYSCTVNMEVDDTDIGELYKRFDMCVQQHREFINE